MPRGGSKPLTEEQRIERFLRRVEPMEPGCWLWIGGRNGSNYGQLRVGPVRVYAHRFSYELFVGPIPEGLTIDHLCRNTLCVNPAHLEPVTIQENIRRKPEQTHCRRGHEFAVVGRYISGTARTCKACHRDDMRRYHAKRSQATRQVAA